MLLDARHAQSSLPGFCPIEEAVSAMACAGIQARGAVFTRREVVNFILDLAGYTADKLHQDSYETTATLVAQLLCDNGINGADARALCVRWLRQGDFLLFSLARNTTTTIMTSPRTAAESGEFSELSELKGLKTFITCFAGHIAAEAARDAS